ncbi:MAG: AAA family ATPase, partial [Rickettsiales bacterium]
MQKTFTIKKITDFFGIPEKKATIYREEKKGLIPNAHKVPRGNSFARVWYEKDLPEIGKKFGFLAKPKNTKIISVFTPKGGVLKSTLAFNLARILALNGVNVLVIGLDVQGTITNNLASTTNYEIADIDHLKECQGLYEASINKDLSI